MRQAGTITDETLARRFVAYLLTQDISTQVDHDSDGWVIWIRDENHLDQAKEELERFQHAPHDPKYQGVEQKAEQILRERTKRHAEATKHVVAMGRQWKRPGAPGGQLRRPLTMVMVALSVVVALASQFGQNESGTVMRSLQFADSAHRFDKQWDWKHSTSDRLIDIKQGEVWRLVTPIFLHLSVLHLVFNMLWLYQLGGAIEHRIGTVRYGFLVLAIAILSGLVQGLAPADWQGSPLGEWGGSPFFGGMSGVVYGLFGYIWMKARFDPAAGYFLPSSTVTILIAWLVICVTGIVGPVANWGHLIGLLVGMGVGYLPLHFKQVKK